MQEYDLLQQLQLIDYLNLFTSLHSIPYQVFHNIYLLKVFFITFSAVFYRSFPTLFKMNFHPKITSSDFHSSCAQYLNRTFILSTIEIPNFPLNCILLRAHTLLTHFVHVLVFDYPSNASPMKFPLKL